MDILTLRELCDEYFRIGSDMRCTCLTTSQRIELAQQMAITMKALHDQIRVTVSNKPGFWTEIS